MSKNRIIIYCYSANLNATLLILLKNFTCETGCLINNLLCNYNAQKKFDNMLEAASDYIHQTVLDGDIQTGSWTPTGDQIIINCNNTRLVFLTVDEKIVIEGKNFLIIKNKEILSYFLVHLSTAKNNEKTKLIMKSHSLINPAGFGKGSVYKNFNYTNPVILY